MKNYWIINIKLLLFITIVYILNQYLLFSLFPFTGLGVISSSVYSIFIFSIIFVLFIILTKLKSIGLNIIFMVFAIIFLIRSDWHNHPSDIGKYPVEELKKSLKTYNNFDSIKLDDIFKPDYRRIAAIYKFSNELPDSIFVLSTKGVQINISINSGIISEWENKYNIIIKENNIIIEGENRIKFPLEYLNKPEIGWKEKNGDVIFLKKRKLKPVMKSEKVFFWILSRLK